MKTTTLVRFDFTADYWDYTSVTDELGTTTRIHTFDSTINCLVMPAGNGGIYVLTRGALRVGAILKDLRDRHGNEILTDINGNTLDVSVQLVEPQISVFGTIEGYKQRVK